MTKDAYYFSHDANARNDQKLLAVRIKYGMRGYGIYFGIIEIMREANAYLLPSNYETIAYDLREPVEDIKSIIHDFGLFKTSDNGKSFHSESLKRRMEHLEDIRVKRIEAGRKGGLSKSLANAKQMSSSKGKESKGKESNNTEPSALEFLSYFNLKTGKNLRMSAPRQAIIAARLKDHKLEELKLAVDNFSKDDWPDRKRYLDVVYCIGVRNKIDNLERWLNYKPKEAWVKP